MNINFRLDRGYIRCDFQYEGQRARFIVKGVSPRPNTFSIKKQRFKSQSINASEYNMLLDKYDSTIKELYAKQKTQGNILSKSEFLKLVESTISGKSYSIMTFQDFTIKFLKNSQTSLKPNTIKSYKTSIRDFAEYEKYRKTELTFNSFDLNFYDDFEDYHFNYKKNGKNTFGNRIKHLKSILNNAYERGLIKNLTFRKFKKPSIKTENVYLTFDEYKKLEDVKLDNYKLELARDLFLIGCETGLRFSDFSQIQKSNINDSTISIITQKTNDSLTIPLSKVVKRILKKYNYDLPNISINATFNKNIKIICQKAGIDDIVSLKKDSNGSLVSAKRKKYEWVSSHTARRSFATNYYTQTDAHIYDLMSITGHSTEKQFLNYIQKNKKEPMKSLILAMNKRFSSTI